MAWRLNSELWSDARSRHVSCFHWPLTGVVMRKRRARQLVISRAEPSRRPRWLVISVCRGQVPLRVSYFPTRGKGLGAETLGCLSAEGIFLARIPLGGFNGYHLGLHYMLNSNCIFFSGSASVRPRLFLDR